MTKCSFYFSIQSFIVCTVKYIYPQQIEEEFGWNQCFYAEIMIDDFFFYKGSVEKEKNSLGHKYNPAPFSPVILGAHHIMTSASAIFRRGTEKIP